MLEGGSREEKRFVGEEKGSFGEKGRGQRESFLFSTPFLREGDVDGGEIIMVTCGKISKAGFRFGPMFILYLLPSEKLSFSPFLLHSHSPAIDTTPCKSSQLLIFTLHRSAQRTLLHHQGHDLVQRVRRRHRRQLRVGVVRRRDFHDVGCHQVDAF